MRWLEDETIKYYAVAYLASLAAFLVIDGAWLALIARNFYASQLGALLRSDLLALPAVGFYLCYVAGLVVLAVRPGQPDLPLLNVALYGALVGFLAYGTYDMTNLATLEDWPVTLSFVDLLWGTVLSSIVSVIGAISTRSLLQ